MEKELLLRDFKEFLRLLNEADVQYLLIGGYAVGYYGYPRSTADMDIWIAISPHNAEKMLGVFRKFGMKAPSLATEVLTQIDGVDFSDCYKA